jgi:hypothetical protein
LVEQDAVMISPPWGVVDKESEKNFSRAITTPFVPRTQRSGPFFTAWCAAEPGPYKARCSLRPRFCEAALRKGYALHRARETASFSGAGLFGRRCSDHRRTSRDDLVGVKAFPIEMQVNAAAQRYP